TILQIPSNPLPSHITDLILCQIHCNFRMYKFIIWLLRCQKHTVPQLLRQYNHYRNINRVKEA
ncbi:hypothetical protein V2J09_016063, partial [Rumex salicifolius]